MPYLFSRTLKPSGRLSTRISKESSICESSAVPVLSHLGQWWFSTQCSRDAIPQICTCGCSDQHSICNIKFEKREFPLLPWNHCRGPLRHLRADHAERQGGRQPRIYV